MKLFDKKKKMFIALPCMNDFCYVSFAVSLHATNWPWGRPPILISKAKWVAKALREMVDKAREHNADFLIWISNDVAWEADDIKKLVKHNVPIVGGWASGRYHPFPCHVGDLWSEEKQKYHIIQNPLEHRGLEKVACLGGEMICFRMDVFKNIDSPWFFGREMIICDKNGVAQDMMTEDFYFFAQARKKGIPIMVDWDVPLFHAAAGLMTYKCQLVTR